MVNYYKDDVLLYEDKVDSKLKKCETLDEGRICWVKVSPHSSPTSDRRKENEVESYYNHGNVY